MKPQSEAKNTNFKMYKSKKLWLFCSTLVCSGIIMQDKIVNADTTGTPDTANPPTALVSQVSSESSTVAAKNSQVPAVSQDVSKEVTKEYIPASDVDPSKDNESVQTFYQGSDGNYSQVADPAGSTSYVPLTSHQQQEVDEATAAGTVATTYATDQQQAVAAAVESGAETVDDKKVVVVDDAGKLPTDINRNTQVTTIDHRDYYSLDQEIPEDVQIGEVGEQLFVIENGVPTQRITFDADSSEPIFTAVTEADLADYQNAHQLGALTVMPIEKGAAIDEIVADLTTAYQNGDQYLGMFKLLTTTDSAVATDLMASGKAVADLTTPASSEPVAPVVADNVVITTVYEDNGTYYTLNKDTGGFTALTADQLADLDAAKAAGDNIVVTKYVTDDNLIKVAVENGASYIQIGDDYYKINLVNQPGDIPTGAASYAVLKPNALPATDLKTGQSLTTIDAVNPGIKVSFFDYSIDPSGQDKESLSSIRLANNINYDYLDNLGINGEGTLKFSPGGNGLSQSANVPANSWASGRLVSGIYGTALKEGYPTVATTGESVAYLFNNESGMYKQVVSYDTLLKLFASDGQGGYSFDSARNSAHYEDADFAVYNKASNRANSNKGQFFPLDDVSSFFDGSGNPVDFDTAVDKSSINHYFGMKMSVPYIQPADGQVTATNGSKQDMVFNFSGDDDFLLYIDGQLVLDLGGIHSLAKGSINFATGKITRSIIEGTTEKPIITTATLASVLGSEWNKTNQEHQIEVFYMERGNNESNLKVSFNLQIPQYYYATQTSYGIKTTPANPLFVYAADVGGYLTNDTQSFAYATSSNYGVRLVENEPDGPTDPETPEVPEIEDEPGKPTDPKTPEEPEVPEISKTTGVNKVSTVVMPVTVATNATPASSATITILPGEKKDKETLLPQTDVAQSKTSIWGVIMLAFASALGLGMKAKRKNED